MRIDFRRWKLRGGLWVIVAVAAVVTALVVTAAAAPSSDFLARVNGEEITRDDVYRMQVSYYWRYGEDLSDSQALELLILERLLYREAEKGGHVPGDAETEYEWQTYLEMTLEEIKAQLELDGLSYDEYFEDFRTTLAILRFQLAVYDTFEVTEEEARDLYQELSEPGDDLEPFEDMKEELIAFLKHERWLDHVREIRNNAEVEKYL